MSYGFRKEITQASDANDKKVPFKRMVDYYLDIDEEVKICVCFFYESLTCRDHSWKQVETSCNLSINDEFMELKYTEWWQVRELYSALTGKDLKKVDMPQTMDFVDQLQTVSIEWLEREDIIGLERMQQISIQDALRGQGQLVIYLINKLYPEARNKSLKDIIIIKSSYRHREFYYLDKCNKEFFLFSIISGDIKTKMDKNKVSINQDYHIKCKHKIPENILLEIENANGNNMAM